MSTHSPSVYTKGEGELPIMHYTGRYHPKGEPFFMLKVYKRIGISQVEVMHLSMLSPRGGDPGHMWGI